MCSFKSKGKMDLSKQRVPLMLALVSIVASFVYFYIYELLLVAIVLLMTWKGYDYIQDITKETLDSSGKYVFITGCDSGKYNKHILHYDI